MVGGIGFLATVPVPWKTASMMACLLIAMLSALRTSGSSNGFIMRVVGEVADVQPFLLHDGEVRRPAFSAAMSAGFG